MGWIKDSKANSMASDAKNAWDEGAMFFTPLLNMPAFKLGTSGRIKDWEPMLEAIVAQGWVLQHWAVAGDDKGRPQAMPLFVRGR
ncbi:hypothetical protein [Cellulomonas sp. HZM]|uniref:hypothetical protein n=1 Tax=Cellulomonas sp. HZM TaxID=1454010 RepID=UPI000493037F|nr:hypothetical protein [Cellulomonas sp. HZM]